MQRRTFITVSTAATAVAATSRSTWATSLRPVSVDKVFTVKTGKDRFNEPILYRGVNPNLVKISAKDTGGMLSMFEYEGIAKMGPELHVHFDQDEVFYVVEGEFLFQTGVARLKLKAGDTIFLPRKIAHTWLQLSDKGKLIYLLQPAGTLEDFFKKMNTFKRPPTTDEVKKVMQEHGMDLVGPPITK